jgi:autotransporter translocation and assembly factor TamB
LHLDLGVSMPRRVFVRGRGLDSEWAGDLTVTGTADAPVIAGKLNLVRGYLSILTKNFQLRSGTVTLSGGPDAVPELNIVADHESGDVTVTAKVTGDATNPTVELSSNPYLPEDEIVSRVLFGKNTTQLTPLEAAQLAAAVAELSGAVGGGPGILDFTRELVGVDVLRLDGGESGGGVEAGKYLTDGVYVGVKKGLTPESDEVRVEVEVTPNISVESETGATGESDIGVRVEWDY